MKEKKIYKEIILNKSLKTMRTIKILYRKNKKNQITRQNK